MKLKNEIHELIFIRKAPSFLFSGALALLVLAGVFSGSTASAYQSTLDTGEIISTGKYRGLLELQSLTGDNGGMNVVGRFDAGVSESSNIRALIGMGSVNFNWGVYYKWIPYPDYDNQPALGLMGGLEYANLKEGNVLSWRVHPLISKRFELDFGVLTPYGSLPFGMSFGNGETKYPFSLVAGTEYRHPELTDWAFFLETGLQISNSFNYLSIGASYSFDNIELPKRAVK